MSQYTINACLFTDNLQPWHATLLMITRDYKLIRDKTVMNLICFQIHIKALKLKSTAVLRLVKRVAIRESA